MRLAGRIPGLCLGLLVLPIVLHSAALADVTTYPAPAGEAVTNDYAVTVNGKPVDVYAAQTEHFDGDYSFASFDFSGTVEIRVTSTEPLDNVLIQPASFAVQVKEKRSQELTLLAAEPFRISIERNGRIKPLLLFGNAEETDASRPDDPNVVYFPPGVHRPGKIMLTDNQTLYLAGGAVVKGCVLAQGENITIRGRGMLAGEESPRFKGPGRYLLDCRDCRNVTVRDITIRNPWSWTFVTWNCDGVLVDNVKICGSRMINDDALDLVNTENAVVRNCFFRTQDDCIAIKGLAGMTRPCENILIEDCEFWTDAANIFRIGYECETAGMRKITARNIDVLHYSQYREPTQYWAHAIIWLQPNQNMVMEQCRFENFRVRSSGDDIVMLMAKPMSCSYRTFKNPEPGSIRNCSFKNIEVYGEEGNFRGLLYLLGNSEKHDVSGMVFEDVTYFGRPILQNSPSVEIGPFVGDVHFRSPTDWLEEAQIGAFMHFLPGDAASFAKVDDFDVDALAEQLEEMGAKYFVLTLGQNSGWFNAPNATYDRVTGYQPGERCSRRDLPLDLYRALQPKGIRLMLYLPCQTPNRDTRAQAAFGLAQGPKDQPIDVAFARQWAEVIGEWSARYGDKVSGWWFDGGYEWVGFNEDIARIYADAVKRGNPEAIVTFNPGVSLIRHTQAEDYTAGELNDPFPVVPTSRWVVGSQWHALTFLGSSWAQRDVREPNQRWRQWFQKVVAHGGAVTLDMGPNWDPAAGPIGSIGPAQAEQFTEISRP